MTPPMRMSTETRPRRKRIITKRLKKDESEDEDNGQNESEEDTDEIEGEEGDVQ